jgi:hypothetical protein
LELKEDWNMDGLYISSWIGMHGSRGVFLGKDFWVQSLDMVDIETDLYHHFIMPFDRLSKSEEWPQPILTPSGDLVYSNRGGLVEVRKGMQANQTYLPWCEPWY